VYLSVGHQQMMTDAMKPLGISMWQLSAMAPMHTAGGRLFVDVTQRLASPASRAALLELFGKGDPLLTDAVQTIVDRDFIPLLPDQVGGGPPAIFPPSAIETDPAIVDELVGSVEASIEALRHEIAKKSGSELLEFIRSHIDEWKRVVFDPRSMQAIMAGMEATWWLNDKLYAWLGEKSAADILAQSAPNNVTSEMGLELLDVADAIRPHPEVVEFLKHVEDEGFLDELPHLARGDEARTAIRAWLDKYGMRCAGEIDITRPRWSERPTTLVPLILNNVRNFAPGEGKRRFEQGLVEARRKEQELLERLRALPDGDQKTDEVKRMIDRLRTFVGYREFPKYAMISRYFVYKQALMTEADRLVQSHVLREKEEIFYLTFQELQDVVRSNHVDEGLIAQRKEAFNAYQGLTPPRVLTSDGEMISGAYRRGGVPAGALTGLGVSAGTVEGRARVILEMTAATLEPGDILVTAFTDPSWTPVFVGITGLVTEVGGLMTHGAVIAREYGLPAVVGVEHATRLIRDGQRIRVHGTEGYVEILA
jgi:pyruvate,water dikinase